METVPVYVPSPDCPLSEAELLPHPDNASASTAATAVGTIALVSICLLFMIASFLRMASRLAESTSAGDSIKR
jgi:hypothetical protein